MKILVDFLTHPIKAPGSVPEVLLDGSATTAQLSRTKVVTPRIHFAAME